MIPDWYTEDALSATLDNIEEQDFEFGGILVCTGPIGYLEQPREITRRFELTKIFAQNDCTFSKLELKQAHNLQP